MTEEQKRTMHALFIAGQLLGCEMAKNHTEWARLADELDIEALEKFLEHPPSDFRYADHCREQIKLVKKWRESR